MNSKVEKDSIVKTITGDKLFRFDNVRMKDVNCEIEFNAQGND